MSAEDHVLGRVTADLVAAGLSPLLAPTPAREVLARVRDGESAPAVVREVAASWMAPPSEPVKAEPEPVHVRFAREAGKAISSPTDNRKRVGLEGGNPWQSGQVSITRQVMIEHADPALARRLKAEASR